MKRNIFTIGIGHENTVVALSNQINKVLEEFYDSKVIDIKYVTDNGRHSALIILKNRGKINEDRGH